MTAATNRTRQRVGRRELEGAGVAFDPGNEVAAAREESPDNFATGVIGVGDQQDGLGQVEAGQEEQEFIEQGPPVAVTEEQAFVNPGA